MCSQYTHSHHKPVKFMLHRIYDDIIIYRDIMISWYHRITMILHRICDVGRSKNRSLI